MKTFSTIGAVLALVLSGAARAAPFVVPGTGHALDGSTTTPSSLPLFDGAGRIGAPLNPPSLYSGHVSAVTVTEPGAYAPADLPLTLTTAGNALGQTAQIVPSGYTVTSATVTAAGNACPASSVFTLAGTGTKIIVSDGNGLSGSVVTVSVGGTAGSAADVPANPVTLTSTTSGCTPPEFSLGWGLAGAGVTLGGWGYQTAPAATPSGSSLSAGSVATVVATLTTAPVNLSSELIPSSQKGVPSGVAGLDANGNVTANLLTGKMIAGADAFANYLSDTFAGGFDPARGYEADLIGGWRQYADGTYMQRQVLQQTDPYGPYSAGCGYALNMLGSVYTSRNPISEQPPEGGATSIVAMGGFDTAAHCILFGNQQARLVLPVASYTATSIVLQAPLTASQAAQIHPSMYVTTNSPNPALSLTNTAGTLPKRNLYAAVVKTAPAAGDTTIAVWGWDVPSWGTGASGQVPQTTTLDTVWSKYTSPVVFIGGGAASSAFANNWYAIIDARDLIPSATNKSLIHQFTMDEEDGPTVVNGTAPANSIYFQGHSMNAGNQPAALTTDSYEYLFGGDIPHHIVFDGGIGNWLIDGDNIFVPSLKQQQLTTDNPTQSYQIWQMPVGVGTKNQFQMVLWNDSGNPSAADGWQRVVTHLGPTVDGAIPADGDPGGSKQGDIEWNVGANYGSISLCGYATTCGLRVNGDGTVNISGAVSAGAINSSSLTSTGAVSGKSLAATADVSGATVTAAGKISGGSVSTTGVVSAGSVSTSGAATFGGDITIGAGGMLHSEGADSIDTGRILLSITSSTSSFEESARLWCRDCLNSGQASGAGTGRWVFKDSAGTWRSDDGVVAAN
ncbi:MAG: hypothetical protein ABF932_13535 [Gluconobacter potus]|uniref:Uncharacterized protein n=1 Tax=Gluconobacter potus TaxID=2724927 RepID=A0ABR9YNE3_9PROT|nr:MULTISPECIES: hypothetical protein [Gluconobacter]MBF0865137.1 hypothetical protein [Gluconobacter sp. R71656]MBF0868353.1 hypothetical protein [Gluconobacter sp. R75628]MBF0874275.1 hypothetical protein [Gluconobacter sp. R75629]MBF0883326.1 hypothetical protein [Gluconobacter potus]